MKKIIKTPENPTTLQLVGAMIDQAGMDPDAAWEHSLVKEAADQEVAAADPDPVATAEAKVRERRLREMMQLGGEAARAMGVIVDSSLGLVLTEHERSEVLAGDERIVPTRR